MINLSSEPKALKSDDKLYIDFCDSINDVLKLGENKAKFIWGFTELIGRLRISEKDVKEFVATSVLFCNEAYRRQHSGNVAISKYFNIKRLKGRQLVTFRTGVKILLLCMWKRRAILLPYEFARPMGKWLQSPNIEQVMFSDLALAFVHIDVVNDSESKPRRGQTPAERKNSRLSQMGVKVFIASSWFSPEDITFEDMQAWRVAQKTMKKNSGGSRISPIPMQQIAQHVEAHFPSRLPFTISDLSKKLSSAQHLLLEDQSAQLLHDIFMSKPDSKKVMSFIRAQFPIGINIFSSPDIKWFCFPALWAACGLMCGDAYDMWIDVQTSYMQVYAYETKNIWRTLFGRLNVYLFVYLPLWFKENPLAPFEYPDEPRKFNGFLFYKSDKDMAIVRPVSLFEFYEHNKYSFEYATASNLRLFFEYLVDHSQSLAGCEGMRQPIHWLPRSKKYGGTKKKALNNDQELLYSTYMLTVMALEVHINENIDTYLEFCRRGETSKNGLFIDLHSTGYVPFCYIDGKACPIEVVHKRALNFVYFCGLAYFNPASFTFPYCLIRGGFRGQNLQWLDSRTYDRYALRDGDRMLGVDSVYVNTDKVQTSGFTVFTRASVLYFLDKQNAWRMTMISLGCSAYSYEVWYDGKGDSKWGKIQCLFASDADTGMPVTDSCYEGLVTYSQLGFQVWLRANELLSEQVVAFIGTPADSYHPRKYFFEWDEWITHRHSGLQISEKYIEVESSEPVALCPVNLRAKVTPHGGRSTHLTKLLQHMSPEEVALTTGQAAGTTTYYDNGRDSLMRRFQGAFNSTDEGKTVLTPEDDVHTSLAKKLTKARADGKVSSAVADLNLMTVQMGYETDALKIIATDRNCNILGCTTHMCIFGFVCPSEVVMKLNGVMHCAQCWGAIFTPNLIFGVSAKRHQVSEEFCEASTALKVLRLKNVLEEGEIQIAEQKLKVMAAEMISWYLVERSLDIMLQKLTSENPSAGILVANKSIVLSEISRLTVKIGSSEEFLRRLDEVCEFPSTISPVMRDKINRATRLIMMQSGDLFEALMVEPPKQPELHLAGIIREKLEQKEINVDGLIALLSLSKTEWLEEVKAKRISILPSRKIIDDFI